MGKLQRIPFAKDKGRVPWHKTTVEVGPIEAVVFSFPVVLHEAEGKMFPGHGRELQKEFWMDITFSSKDYGFILVDDNAETILGGQDKRKESLFLLRFWCSLACRADDVLQSKRCSTVWALPFLGFLCNDIGDISSTEAANERCCSIHIPAGWAYLDKVHSRLPPGIFELFPGHFGKKGR